MSAKRMLKTFTEDYREEISHTTMIRNVWSPHIFNERFHEHGGHDYDVIRRGNPK